MYAGLTTADKVALLGAKRDGLTEYGIEVKDEFGYWRIEPVNISLALAQIAEMESAEKPSTPTPLTWNERINQMTAEEKAREFFYQGNGDYFSYISINGEHCETPDEAIEAGIKWLNSPYTEGETENV